MSGQLDQIPAGVVEGSVKAMKLSFRWAVISRDKHDSLLAKLSCQLSHPLTDSVVMKWTVIINNNQNVLGPLKWSSYWQPLHHLGAF